MILLKMLRMQGGEISSKLKEIAKSTPFQLQAFSSYATQQMGYFQRNLYAIMQ
jgi:hypothetical protein